MGKKADAKDWKAVTLDWTELESYDHDEQLGICLTQRQVAILKALLVPAYWTTRWTSLTATPDELDNFVSQIDFKLDGNDCEAQSMLFRDNPDDGCEVQYSTDGGVIWLTMFRKDNCTPPTKPINITQIYIDIDIMNTNNTTYAGDIINCAPDWEYTDPDQDNSLCYAIDFYVDAICELAIGQIESGNVERRDSNNWLFELTDVLAAGVVATLVAVAALAGVVTIDPILIGVAAWAAGEYAEAWLDGLVTKSSEQFENETAKQVIKCAMYDNIQGATPQFNLWQHSLDNWASYGGDYKAIAEQVHILNQDLNWYINYMMLMEDLNSIGDLLPACPCPATWSHTWDFANYGKDTWYVDKLGTPDAIGYWSPGVGFVAEDLPGGHGKNTLNFAYFPEPVPRVTHMICTYDCVKGHWDNNTTAVELTMDGVGTQQWNQSTISTEEGQQKELIAALGDATEAHVFLRSSWDETLPHDLGSMILTHVEFQGVGVDPFSGRITS